MSFRNSKNMANYRGKAKKNPQSFISFVRKINTQVIESIDFMPLFALKSRDCASNQYYSQQMKMTNTNQMIKPYYFFHNLWLIGSMKTVLFIQWDKRNFQRQNLNCWSLWKVLSNPQEIRFKSDLHIYPMKFCGDADLKIWLIIGKNSVK